MSVEDQKMCAIFFVLPGHHSLPSHQNKKVFKMCHNMSAGLNFLPFHSDQSHNMKWGTTNNQIFHKTTKWPNTLATFGTCDQSYIKGSPQIESLEKFGLLSQLKGGGSANPKFWSNFSKGVFVAIWRGFPSPNQQNHQKSHKKSSVTQKVWLFHEKIICLE